MAEDTAFHSVTAAMAVLQSGGTSRWLGWRFTIFGPSAELEEYVMYPLVLHFAWKPSTYDIYISIYICNKEVLKLPNVVTSYCSISSVHFIFWPTQPPFTSSQGCRGGSSQGCWRWNRSIQQQPEIFVLPGVPPALNRRCLPPLNTIGKPTCCLCPANGQTFVKRKKYFEKIVLFFV